MTKSSTIEAIRTLNPTASTDFLAAFSPDELTQYLGRLNRVSPEPPPKESVNSDPRHHSPSDPHKESAKY